MIAEAMEKQPTQRPVLPHWASKLGPEALKALQETDWTGRAFLGPDETVVVPHRRSPALPAPTTRPARGPGVEPGQAIEQHPGSAARRSMWSEGAWQTNGPLA